MLKGLRLIAAAITLLCFFSACATKESEIGSEKNPIKFFFVPSVDAGVIDVKSKLIKAYLEKNTPYKYDIRIPNNYVAVVESFGTKRADIATITTYGYLLAHKKYGAEAKLTYIRHGESTYKSEIIARVDGPINSLDDINGRKFAYVDPASTSGYVLPAKLFVDRGIKPSETVFARKHDNVVTMVYQGQVDAGACYYSPPADGKMEDARKRVLTQFPDVEDKVKIVELTEPIPNDPIIFRKDLPEEVKATIIKALFDYIKTDEGRDAFYSIYGATEFHPIDDQAYEVVLQMIEKVGASLEEMAK